MINQGSIKGQFPRFDFMAKKVWYKFDLGLAADGVTNRKFAVKLFEVKIKDFAGRIGLTKAAKAADLEGFEQIPKLSDAVRRGLMMPLKLTYAKTTTTQQTATIFVPRDKIEEALKAQAFKDEKYNGKEVISVNIPSDRSTSY